MSEKATGWDLDCEVEARIMERRIVRPYSTQECAVLAVVEEMRKRGYGVVMTRMAGEDGWGVNFVDHERRTAPGESAPTLPEAICRAALRVLDEAALSTAGEVKA